MCVFGGIEAYYTHHPFSTAKVHYHYVAFDQESHFTASLCCCSQVFIELYNICTMDEGFYVQALQILSLTLSLSVGVCVCGHLVCGSVE